MTGARGATWTHAIAPVISCVGIALGLLLHAEKLPWIPVVSETIGLAAVLVAPGLAVEPCFRGKNWGFAERLGLIGVMSLACTGVAGVGLHLMSMSVSTTNVLIVLLGVSVLFGLASIPLRAEVRRWRQPTGPLIEIAVGIGSMALVVGAFATILLSSPRAPAPFEAALVSGDGTLLVQPLRTTAQFRQRLSIVLRSPPGEPSSVDVSVEGPGIQGWSMANVATGDRWRTLEAEIVALRDGVLRANVRIQGSGIDLSLPIQMLATGQ